LTGNTQPQSLTKNKPTENLTGAPGSPKRTPDFLSSFLALAHFMRFSLMKAAYAGVGGAPCRKSGYVGRKRWAQPNERLLKTRNWHFLSDLSPPSTSIHYGMNPAGEKRFTLAP
jgi:hypothetical protein